MKKVVLFFVLLVTTWNANGQGMPVIQWQKYATASSPGSFESVATDKWGNVISVGEYHGTKDFDPGVGVFNMSSNGQSNAFIVKLDSNGNFVWAKSLGGLGYATVNKVVVDTFGNVYTSGSISDSGDFDPGPSIYMMGCASKQIFISKLDLNGNFVWARTLTNTSLFNADIDVDFDGNMYAYGWYHDTVDFDPGPNTYFLDGTNDGTSDGSLFLWKLDNNGSLVWVNNFKDDSSCYASYQYNSHYIQPYSIYVDKINSNVLISGITTVDLGIYNPNHIYAGLQYLFFAKFNFSGNFIWANSIYTHIIDYNNTSVRIISDNYGSVFLVINYLGTWIEFDPSQSSVLIWTNFYPLSELIVAKYNSSGSFSWVKTIEDAPAGKGNSVAFNKANELLISGYIQDSVDFDLGPGVHRVGSNTFNSTDFSYLYKIDTSGNFKWVFAAVDSFYDNHYTALSIDYSGKIYTVGDSRQSSVTKFYDDPCATFNILLDSIHSVICGSTAFVKVSAQDGTTPYAYQWSNSQTTPNISPTTGGVYTVVVHDGIGCVDSQSFLINAPAFPNTYFDLNSNFVNVGSLTTWTNSPIGLDVFNDGCIPQTGTVKMVLDSLLTYYSAYPTPSQIIGDTVVWNYSNLNYNSPHFQPHVTVNPLGNMGDTVCVTTIIDPITGDANPANNAKTNCYVITGSFDPNDISVYPQGVCDSGYVLPNTTFTYTIDFQNVGNDTAKKFTS